MNLTASLAATPTRTRGPRCSVGVLLERLDRDEPEQATNLRVALTNTDIPLSVLSRALGREGERIAPITLARHAGRPGRPRECTCTA